MWIQPLGWKEPLEEEMATHSSNLAWEIPWTEEPGWPMVHGVTKSQTRLSIHKHNYYKHTCCLQAEGEGHEGFPPPPEKDLESPSSTRLEALVPSGDSRARTRSPSPRAWRPDFPGAAREAP